jgi:type I restriction enzyme S subunit
MRVPLSALLCSCDTGTWGGESDASAGDPVLRSTNIQNNLMNLRDVAWRDLSDRHKESKALLDGDILVTASSGSADLIGKCAIFRQPNSNVRYYFSNFTLRLRPDLDVVDPRWLHNWLTSARGRAVLDSMHSTTTGLRNLDKAQYLAQLVPCPPIAEQHRIADLLDLADGIRRKRREALRLADELVRATFLEMFGDPVGNPRGWPTAHLGDLSTDLRYGTSAKCTETKGESDLPVLRIPNVIGGKVGYTDLKYASLPGNEVRLTTLEPGDLLFVRSNGNPEHIGRCAVFDGADEPYLFASYLIRARLRTQLVADSHFLQYQLSSPRYREALARMARTTAGNYNVSAEALSKLKIIAPPMELQQKFLASVGAADRYLASASKGLEEAESLFSSLQNQAFGEPQ